MIGTVVMLMDAAYRDQDDCLHLARKIGVPKHVATL